MMRRYFVLLPIFFLALVQGAILPLNLVLLVVLGWATIRPVGQSLLIAFFSGLFLDLTKGRPLGVSSLLLLVVSGVLLVYRRRFDPLHFAFLPVFVFFSSLVFDLAIRRFWAWRQGLVLAILAFLFRLFVGCFQEREGSIRLREGLGAG